MHAQNGMDINQENDKFLRERKDESFIVCHCYFLSRVNNQLVQDT